MHLLRDLIRKETAHASHLSNENYLVLDKKIGGSTVSFLLLLLAIMLIPNCKMAYTDLVGPQFIRVAYETRRKKDIDKDKTDFSEIGSR